MLRVTDSVAIAENELTFEFLRASGPGGQHVNKVSTAVQLRFDVRRSTSLPASVRRRLMHQAGHRMTADGILIIRSQRHRSQHRNRQEALDRLVRLIRQALKPPKYRIPSRPSINAKKRRLAAKRHRSRLKKMRQGVSSTDD
jgi:ribosome-associated protein